MRALVAEDDAELRRLLTSVLEQEGYLVVEVGSLGAMLEKLTSPSGPSRFDLVVSDARIPGWSGFRVQGSLRSMGARTPLVLLANTGDRETRLLAQKVGAVLLSEPVDPEGFRAVVRSDPDPAA